MINLFRKGMRIISKDLTQYDQLRVNAENEYHAMCCGVFSPRFSAKIKKCKTD